MENPNLDNESHAEKSSTNAPPIKFWAAVFAIIALTLQSISYYSTAAFYLRFGVSAEEVGFSYADILGRQAVQIAVSTLMAVFVLALASALLPLSVGRPLLIRLPPRRDYVAADSTPLDRREWAKVTGVGLAFAGLFAASLLIDPKIGGVAVAAAIALAGTVTVALVLRARGRVDLARAALVGRQNYSNLRLYFLLVAVGSLSFLGEDWLEIAFWAMAVVVLNGVLPRSVDFANVEVPTPKALMHRGRALSHVGLQALSLAVVATVSLALLWIVVVGRRRGTPA
jgi:hypothetical protein